MSKTGETETSGQKSSSRAASARAGLAAVRTWLARLVRLGFGALATVLALGVLLVVLRENVSEANPVVRFVYDVAEAVDGPLSREDGIFAFSGGGAVSKNALANWGVAALCYLILGRVLSGLLLPRSSRS